MCKFKAEYCLPVSSMCFLILGNRVCVGRWSRRICVMCEWAQPKRLKWNRWTGGGGQGSEDAVRLEEKLKDGVERRQQALWRPTQEETGYLVASPQQQHLHTHTFQWGAIRRAQFVCANEVKGRNLANGKRNSIWWHYSYMQSVIPKKKEGRLNENGCSQRMDYDFAYGRLILYDDKSKRNT